MFLIKIIMIALCFVEALCASDCDFNAPVNHDNDYHILYDAICQDIAWERVVADPSSGALCVESLDESCDLYVYGASIWNNEPKPVYASSVDYVATYLSLDAMRDVCADWCDALSVDPDDGWMMPFGDADIHFLREYFPPSETKDMLSDDGLFYICDLWNCPLSELKILQDDDIRCFDSPKYRAIPRLFQQWGVRDDSISMKMPTSSRKQKYAGLGRGGFKISAVPKGKK